MTAGFSALPPRFVLAMYASDPIALPGLVDLQVNGWDGVDFNQENLTVEQLDHVSAGMASGGVTRYLPTIVTASRERLLHALVRLGEALKAVERRDAPTGALPIGIHLEGPYLSGELGYRGAHPAADCRDPDWEEFQAFQQASGDRIRLLTLAPERAGAIEFIERVRAAGVVISIGHTAASGEIIRAAAKAGASMVTHVGNGCAATLPRHPNLLWEELAEDSLVGCFIADGHHLPDATLKVMLRAKGLARSVLVSDVQGLGGKPPGRYSTPHLGEVELLPEGRAVVADQRVFLAGAVARLHESWPVFRRVTGGDLGDWSQLASINPLNALGLDGDATDVALFARDGDRLIPRATRVSGRIVFKTTEQNG
ncbi:MAG TPA: N-acetylglucosamine-6-phosphate deacetylase [Pirellulaceae bacterium]|jgi:N-acetylglucosamine-6-phosphate deacetylase|nr:N-acetylglucosamine-6-phosphate deacetylase [Pirellulaceae bacterium]